jgi:hypothetical protein
LQRLSAASRDAVCPAVVIANACAVVFQGGRGARSMQHWLNGAPTRSCSCACVLCRIRVRRPCTARGFASCVTGGLLVGGA